MIDDIHGLDGKPRPDLYAEIWEDSYKTRDVIRGANVVDVGANIGMYSIWAVEQGANRVLAIEPFIENVQAMRANVQRCGVQDSVQILRAGVAARGVTECGVMVRGTVDEPEVRSTGVHTMPGKGSPAVDFHEVLAHMPDVDVMKIDCEGAEYDFVLTADHDDVARVPHIALEFHIWRLRGDPPDPGFGERSWGPRPRHHELLEFLSVTHDVNIVGHIDKGGYMVATSTS